MQTVILINPFEVPAGEEEHFLNVAEWESLQHFQAAMSNEAFQQIRAALPFTAYPALYQVIAE
jgi:quinol monooxygenase YgiN